MIARLRGEVLELSGSDLVVDCVGVGYLVHLPMASAVRLEIGARVDLFVRHIQREDDVSLYGFLSSEQRRLFDLLRDVKGCGAKMSLSVLSTLSESEAAVAITSADARTLARAPGVGPKLAERIILELKDKVGGFALATSGATVVTNPAPEMTELAEALMALGYRRGEVEPVLDDAEAEGADLPAKIRAALKRLQK